MQRSRAQSSHWRPRHHPTTAHRRTKTPSAIIQVHTKYIRFEKNPISTMRVPIKQNWFVYHERVHKHDRFRAGDLIGAREPMNELHHQRLKQLLSNLKHDNVP